MKRTVILCSLTLCAVFYSGCMAPRELKERTIIEAVGIDQQEGEIEVSLKELFPGGTSKKAEQKNSQSMAIAQAKGKSISQALDSITHYKGSEVFLGNSTYVVLGKETAKRGMNSYLSFFNSVNEVDPGIYFVVADGEAGELMKQLAQDKEEQAAQVQKVLEQGQRGGTVGKATLMEVLQRLHSDGSAAYLPVLQQIEGKEGVHQLHIAGTAIFRGDQMQAVLDVEQTRGLLWLTNEIEHGILALDVPGIGVVSVEVQGNKTKIRPTIRSGVPHFTVEVKTTGKVQEVMKADGGGVTQEEMQRVARLSEEKIQHMMHRAVEKALWQEQCDVFRFSDFLKKYQPNYWKENKDNWKQLMPCCTVAYKVTCKIDQTGLEAVYGKAGDEKGGGL